MYAGLGHGNKLHAVRMGMPLACHGPKLNKHISRRPAKIVDIETSPRKTAEILTARGYSADDVCRVCLPVVARRMERN